MKLHSKITLKSPEVNVMMKVGISDKPLLPQALHKIGIYYTHAKEHKLYAFTELATISQKVDALMKRVNLEHRKTEEMIVKKWGSLPELSPAETYHYTLPTNTPLHFLVTQCIKRVDDYIMLLNTARLGSIYGHQNQFFRSKSYIRKKLHSLLSSIATLKTKDFPEITIEHYLDRSPDYLENVGIRGEVAADWLYLALTLPYTPEIAPEYFNVWAKALRDQHTQSEVEQVALDETDQEALNDVTG